MKFLNYSLECDWNKNELLIIYSIDLSFEKFTKTDHKLLYELLVRKELYVPYPADYRL